MDIQLLALDVDGVLTDGGLHYSSTGEEMKVFNTLDGLGITALRNSGIAVAIITGRASQIVARRAQELRVDHLHMGCRNKTQALLDICQEKGISLAQVAYMGDDLNDLGPLSKVGLPLAPANACADVKERARFVTQRPGGQGAVREAVEYILKAQNRWDKVLASYENESYEVGQ